MPGNRKAAAHGKTPARRSKRAAAAADGPPHHSDSGAPPAALAPAIETAIGVQVRHLRFQLGLRSGELAAQAGISASALSKIENGQISPSLSTLTELARALNVPISALFAAFEDRRDCSYVAAGQGMKIERRGTRAGHDYRLLGQALGGAIAVEPFLITLTEDARPFTAFRHEGREFIYMLAGALRYRHGERAFTLTPGDSLMFDSGASHGPEDILKRPCTYLSIIIYAAAP
ncbi:MAG: helix-turn-helix domain-containing protein [Hyphomonadaceae bacterium]